MDEGLGALQLPLEERIGAPYLMVARQKEFASYHRWIEGIPRKASKSLALLGRKKCGKTAFVQRLFNQVWSAGNGVIPFYMEITEKKMHLADLAVQYYCTFVSHYISYLERDPGLVARTLNLQEIREYGQKNDIYDMVKDPGDLENFSKNEAYDSMWMLAVYAPHRYAVLYKRPVLVIIDEFQNLNGFVYTDKQKTLLDQSIPGSYHEVSESKVAPMLATGSAVGWLTNVIDQFLAGGR